jgi:hypothetical protein
MDIIEVGTEFVRRGQWYQCVGFEPYVRRDGVTITLTVLESRCAKCSGAFITKTSSVLEPTSWLSRRCDKHKRPGVKVRSRRKEILEHA